MRMSFAFLVVFISSLLIAAGPAPGDEALSVEQMEFCAAVNDRVPVGSASTFPSDISRVYCFTRITGATDTLTVAHVWYYGDRELARVDLDVKSASWRTWSSKKMDSGWKGAWRVDVVYGDTTVVASKGFILE